MSEERNLSEVQADDLIDRVLAGSDPEVLVDSMIEYVNEGAAGPYHLGSKVKINKPWAGSAVDGSSVTLKKDDVVSIVQPNLGEHGQDKMVLFADGKTRAVVPYNILGEDDTDDLGEQFSDNKLTHPAGYDDPSMFDSTGKKLTAPNKALEQPWPKGFPEKKGMDKGHVPGTAVGKGAAKHDPNVVQKSASAAQTAKVTPDMSGKSSSKSGVSESDMNDILLAFNMMKEGAKQNEVTRIDAILQILQSGEVAEDALADIYTMLFSEATQATLEDIEEKCKKKKKKMEGKEPAPAKPIIESKKPNPWARFDSFKS